MVSLEIGIDAAGVANGGAQASSALGGIAQAAALATQALAGSSTAMAGMSAALTAAMPWISAIGAALSGITTGILLFSQRTQEATTEWTKFVASMREASALESLLPIFPGATADPQQAREKAAFDAAQTLREQQFLGTATARSTADVASALGMTEQSVRDSLAEIERRGGISTRHGSDPETFRRGSLSALRLSGEGRFESVVTSEGQVQLFSDFAERSRIRRAGQNPQPGFMGPVRPGFESFSLEDELAGTARDPFGLQSGQRMGTGTVLLPSGIEQDKFYEMIESRRAVEQFEEIRQSAAEIGAALGDGAWDFLTGVSSARDVVGSIANDLGRGILRGLSQQLVTGIVDLAAPA